MLRLPRRLSKNITFTLLVLLCVCVAGGFVAFSAVNASTSSAGAAQRAAEAARLLAEASERKAPYLLFRDLSSPGEAHAEIALIPLEGLAEPSTRAGLGCARVHLAAGRGLCLAFDVDPLPGYKTKVFGADFRVRHSIGLEGIPSRARVSPDGRYGAFTVFLTGHSYRDLQFSTRTAILNMRSGQYVVENLEELAVSRDGERIRSRDFNFWGVTFAADSSRFYATLWTRRRAYLVEGDLHTRSMRVLRENAECPSLSPDGTRLVYKKRADATGPWRFHVLDIATQQETPLAETVPRDDQVEWLDNEYVAYEGGGQIWRVPADGTGTPELLVKRAYSPVIVRGTDG